jgi:uncharacterized protein (TIGR01319 family)
MLPYLLIDFGSTYTKMTAVDLDAPAVLGRSSALTTVDDGLIVGYRRALRKLEEQTGKIAYSKQLACSSAAGGLKIVAIGLVPELTGEAAKRAALGAGARVLKTYGFELSPSELEEIGDLRPDLVVLSGGTDGGNQTAILHNAKVLAGSGLSVPIVIAGNKSAAAQVESVLTAAGKVCYRCANVLPKLGELQVGPVRQLIREIFLKWIIHAKGLDRVERMIDGIMMPTPAAVLQAAVLLAEGGGPEQPGWGELLLVDVGGATTDVHSVAQGLPTRADVGLRGLPEPRVKRTVEGDLGMRCSAPALLETFPAPFVAELAGLTEAQVRSGIAARAANVEYLPDDPAARRLETILGFLAVKGAVERHAGRMEQVYTPQGTVHIQVGKDLTGIRLVIGTGGVIAHHKEAGPILAGALYDPFRPEILKPGAPVFRVDRDYILPTLGLIAGTHPRETWKLLAAALEKAETAVVP